MAVLTAQALLGLNLFEFVLSGLEKTSLSALRHRQHRQRSGALTLLALKVGSACQFLSGETLSFSRLYFLATRENSRALILMYGRNLTVTFIGSNTEAIIST